MKNNGSSNAQRRLSSDSANNGMDNSARSAGSAGSYGSLNYPQQPFQFPQTSPRMFQMQMQQMQIQQMQRQNQMIHQQQTGQQKNQPDNAQQPRRNSQSGNSTTTPAAGAGTQAQSSTSASGTSAANKSASATAPPSKRQVAPAAAMPLEPAAAAVLLKNCDWIDKTLWASRQLLGGQAVNGFQRSTATVQRIKKQRARQNSKVKKPPSSKPVESEQESEEILKVEIMNPRTAKKLKQEYEQGIEFCVLLHETIRNIVQEMEPTVPQILPLRRSGSGRPGTKAGSHSNRAITLPSQTQPQQPASKQQQPSSKPTQAQAKVTSAGNASGSTLRRNRKTKNTPEPSVGLREFDGAGKRTCTKKEFSQRITQVLRFRELKAGDPVAARVSSRDLWILARVCNDYPGFPMVPAEFLKLSDARREQVFGKKLVSIEDVEDGRSAETQKVARNLVLPLPRTVVEAAHWCSRMKKNSRVYAMYPQTTALYTATVVDCTTYCRGDEDIIVVEFDGDEPDATGKIPVCHIPARFVTLIPREFSGAQANTTPNTTSTGSAKKRKSLPVSVDPMNSVLDEMPFDLDLPGLDDFDDLDFELLGGS